MQVEPQCIEQCAVSGSRTSIGAPKTLIYFNQSDCELWLLSSVDSFVWFSVFYLQFLFHTAALGDGWSVEQRSPRRTRCIIAQRQQSEPGLPLHFTATRMGKKENEAKVELSDWQRVQPLGAVNLTSWMECFTNPQDLFHVSIWEKAHGKLSEMEVKDKKCYQIQSAAADWSLQHLQFRSLFFKRRIYVVDLTHTLTAFTWHSRKPTFEWTTIKQLKCVLKHEFGCIIFHLLQLSLVHSADLQEYICVIDVGFNSQIGSNMLFMYVNFRPICSY